MPKPADSAAKDPAAPEPKPAAPVKPSRSDVGALAATILSGLVAHDNGAAKIGTTPGRAALAAEAVALTDALVAELAK
jgi:hypothetical protein